MTYVHCGLVKLCGMVYKNLTQFCETLLNNNDTAAMIRSFKNVKVLIFSSLLWMSWPIKAADLSNAVTLVNIPLMERPSDHRLYADELLNLALTLSAEKFGPFKIVQHKYQTVVGRQLLELEKGEWLSVAVSMPLPAWLEKADVVHFPIMKGLASYRMFFAHQAQQNKLADINSLTDLRSQVIGQGRGWSTAKILEDNGFSVMYGSTYETLFPMLEADRFQLLMRGVYEIEAEHKVYRQTMPELSIADNIAVYTYLPSYFFVSKKQPALTERLMFGLKKASDSGQCDKLFQRYFNRALSMMQTKQRKIFYLNNTNINAADFAEDNPYLLDYIRKLEAQKPRLELARRITG